MKAPSRAKRADSAAALLMPFSAGPPVCRLQFCIADLATLTNDFASLCLSVCGPVLPQPLAYKRTAGRTQARGQCYQHYRRVVSALLAAAGAAQSSLAGDH